MRFITCLILFVCFLPAFTVAQTVGHTSTGLASYFSDEFHGSTTKYGERYDRNEMVAAHKMYPYNSRVRVTNLENNRSVTVRIIDQGPFIQGRIIEVSYQAAEQLGMLNKNTTRVRIELLSTPDQPAIASQETNTPTTRQRDEAPRVTPPPAPSTNNSQPSTETQRVPPPPAPREATPQPAERVTAPPPATQPTRTAEPQTSSSPNREPATFRRVENAPVTTGNFGPGLYKIELQEPGTGSYGVQIASLTKLESALQEVAKLQAKWFDNILIRKVDNEAGSVYKVILGPFDTQESAQRYAKDLKGRYKIDGFSVNLY